MIPYVSLSVNIVVLTDIFLKWQFPFIITKNVELTNYVNLTIMDVILTCSIVSINITVSC